MSLPENASPLESATNKNGLRLGLFSYPVLQAADILLYNTTHVPVGEDQAQHLEFTRELAIGFNHLYAPKDASRPLLTVPETLLSPAKRVMSLVDPTKKMSKSDPKVKSRILITDSRKHIYENVKTALTDSIEGVSYDPEKRPGVSNLVDLMWHCDSSQASSPEELAKDLADLSMRAFKGRAADAIEARVKDIRGRYLELMGGKEGVLVDIAEDGARRAEAIAEETMKRVRTAVGMRW